MIRLKNILFLLIIIFSIHSCDGIKIPTRLFETSERAKYERRFTGSDSLMMRWKNAFSAATANQLKISEGFSAVVNPHNQELSALGYSIDLKQGERLLIEIAESENLNNSIFIDLYDGSLIEKVLKSELLKDGIFSHVIERDGTYKIIIQPAIEYKGHYPLKIYAQPSLKFPVAGKGNKDAQSFWGASRDGGNRNHEGVDIFAPRGTPVIAAVDGYIIRTGDQGLGGKQVWLRDGNSGNSLYYAHLDSIRTQNGKEVKLGDTLGLVGNTGNAKGGATHLHFGIYSAGGAVDAYPFIRKRDVPKHTKITLPSVKMLKAGSNLRKGPDTSYEILYTKAQETPIKIVAGNGTWFHVRTENGEEGFVTLGRMK